MLMYFFLRIARSSRGICRDGARSRRPAVSALTKRPECDHVRIAHNLAARPVGRREYAVKLTQGRILVENLAEHCGKIDQIELPVGLGQPAGARHARPDVVDAELGSAPGGVIKNLHLNVDRMDSATRSL
jgi:hypothetical protein